MFMKRFGKLYSKVNFYLTEMLGCYRNSDNMYTSDRQLYAFDSYKISPVASNAGSLKTFFLKIANLCLNFSDLIRAFYSRRKYNPSLMFSTSPSVRGGVQGNLINGTFVIFREESVDKFYFKSHRYYFKLYTYLSQIYPFELFEMDSYLLVSTKRLANVSSNVNDLDVWRLIKCNQDAFERLDDKRFEKELFSPADYVKYLFSNYGVESELDVYVGLAEKLYANIDKNNRTICHGDVWVDNILCSEGKLLLIDFDKMLWANKTYDIVYFLFMRYELNKFRGRILGAVNDFKPISLSIIDRLRGQGFLSISEFDVELSLKLLLLFKVTEYALANEKVEDCFKAMVEIENA